MHCPGCGSKISGAHQFCRACGLDLEQVSRFLAAQLLASPRELQGKGQMIEKWGSNLLLGSLGLLYVALCWIIIDQVIIGGGQALAGLALLMILTGITVGLALKGYASSLRKSLNKHEPLRSTGIGSPEDETKLLPKSQVESVSTSRAVIANMPNINVLAIAETRKTRRRVIRRRRPTNGGTGMTTTMPRHHLIRSGSRFPTLERLRSESAMPIDFRVSLRALN